MKVTDTHVYFFTSKDIYSNFYYSPFKHQNILFKWSEQAVMYRKAMLFNAPKIAQQILKVQHPQEAKKLGRSRQIPFDNEIWDQNKIRIYEEVLLDKFSNPKLKSIILAVGDKMFVEASPYDKIWGVGLAEDDPKILDEKNWLGQNLLGKALKNVQLKLGSS